MEFFNQLPSNPWAWLFTAIVAVAALTLAYRSTPQKVLKCIISSNALITKNQSKMSKLSILYEGKSIDNLTVSTVTFWNNSYPTINNTDIIDAAPISILIDGGEILDVSVLQGSDTPNRIAVEMEKENTAKISFDYVDKNEGGIIQIVHTGEKSSIDISRKIKGGKIIVAQSSATITSGYLYFLSALTILCMWYIEAKMPLIGKFGLIIYSMAFCFSGIATGFLHDWWRNKKLIPKNCQDNSSRNKTGIFTRIKHKLEE